ncbi:hypothetical protein V6N12_035530 [Hibiscus sabdariffa]|uniref:Uncharacterized protein n=1 Tax=Hibiscus sabdariffa TaxID=183260 RepID=A0ABR2EN00_9ROSI
MASNGGHSMFPGPRDFSPDLGHWRSRSREGSKERWSCWFEVTADQRCWAARACSSSPLALSKEKGKIPKANAPFPISANQTRVGHPAK